jgi:Ig domain of plant-specific actin-binding protein
VRTITRHERRRVYARVAGTTALAGVLLVTLAAFAGAGSATTAAAPRNTAKPKISGTVREGETLTATTGSWTGDQPITYAFQWIRCSARVSNCNPISGANDNQYTLRSADVGRRLIVSVTARNADGDGRASSDATAVVARRGTAPASSAQPVISGEPREGATLTVSNGSWTGDQPFTFTYQWQRCDRTGGSCAAISGATARTYQLTNADVDRTLRAVVTARNNAGSTAATTVPTAVIAATAPPPPPPGSSISVANVALPDRLIIDRVSFFPNPVRSRNSTITARFRVSDTRGRVISGALVFVRSVPLLTSTPPEQATQQNGTVTFQIQPRANFPLKRGLNVQFFIRARKPGENPLAGVSTRRLVQVRTATP